MSTQNFKNTCLFEVKDNSIIVIIMKKALVNYTFKRQMDENDAGFTQNNSTLSSSGVEDLVSTI